MKHDWIDAKVGCGSHIVWCKNCGRDFTGTDGACKDYYTDNDNLRPDVSQQTITELGHGLMGEYDRSDE